MASRSCTSPNVAAGQINSDSDKSEDCDNIKLKNIPDHLESPSLVLEHYALPSG